MFQLKWKNLKHFTSPKQRAVWRKLFSPLSNKSSLRLWNNNFLTEVYTNVHTFAFLVLHNVVSGHLEMVRSNFFLTASRTMFLAKESGSRFIKWVKFFERNCIVKWMIFFDSFWWLWDFLSENLKLIEKLQNEVSNHLFSGPNFNFLGQF